MWRRLSGAAFLALGFSACASAATINITYTGQIYGGTAPTGVGEFCGINCSQNGWVFNGQPFELKYVFDTNLAAPGQYSSSSLSSSDNIGYNPAIVPVGYAVGSTWIGGVVPDSCGLNCNFTTSDTASAGTVYTQTVSWNYQTYASDYVTTSLFANPAIPGDILTPFSLTGDDIGTGQFSNYFKGCNNYPTGVSCFNGNLQIESVVVETVPLPSSLVLLSSALFMLLAFGWRRRYQHSPI
jgi:hypothetical protein